MKRSIILWILAFLITAASAVYQRVTGPSYPVTGSVTLLDRKIEYRFDRSHGGGNCPVEISTNDAGMRGVLSWRRLNSDDPWTSAPMISINGGALSGELPHQPPAGKLEYRVVLSSHGVETAIPAEGPAVVRFKGDVPLPILFPHILAMFIGMFLSTRAGLAIFDRKMNLRRLVYWTVAFLAVGGLVLGSFVQWFAFGSFWTGWPFGIDLTDNKTAVAVVCWLAVALFSRRSARPERWAFVASIVTLAVFMIPHSVLGSELRYEKNPRIQSTIQ